MARKLYFSGKALQSRAVLPARPEAPVRPASGAASVGTELADPVAGRELLERAPLSSYAAALERVQLDKHAGLLERVQLAERADLMERFASGDFAASPLRSWQSDLADLPARSPLADDAPLAAGTPLTGRAPISDRDALLRHIGCDDHDDVDGPIGPGGRNASDPLGLDTGLNGVPSQFVALVEVTARSARATRPDRPARPGVALALGGGFARGFAHLGILQVFEENHIPISHIAGTSVGSILGAAYASGAPLALIMATCRTLRFRDIARWHPSRLGLASNHRLADLIERVFKARNFEDLRIPMAVVATNLNTSDPVVFTQGSLIDPIRASCAFPGIFEPVEIGTRWLVDGGLIAPVPTRAARELGARHVIGVAVGMQDGHDGKPSSVFQVVSRAVCAAQKHQLELWERHADLVIRPDVQGLSWDDFDRADEAIEAGKVAAQRALPRIQKLLGGGYPDAQEPSLAHPTEFRDSGLHFITEAMGS